MQEGVLRGQGVGRGEGGLEDGPFGDFGELLLALIRLAARAGDVEELRFDLEAALRVLGERG